MARGLPKAEAHLVKYSDLLTGSPWPDRMVLADLG